MKGTAKAKLGLVIALMVGLVACSGDKVAPKTQTDQGAPPGGGPEASGTAGIRPVRQYRATLYAATLLPIPNTTIDTFISTNLSTFSGTGKVEEISPADVLKRAETNAHACAAFGTQESGAGKKTDVYQGVNFAAGPGSITADMRRQILTKLAQMWWRRSPTEAEVLIGLDFMTQFQQGTASGVNNGTQTKNLLLGACTLMATAPESIALM